MELDQGTREDLLDLERRYWSAVQEKDSETTATLSDDPCILVGARGVRRLLDVADIELERFDMEDVHVRRLCDGVVALAYRVKESLVMDGQDVSMEAVDASVCVRRNGDWVCALHADSPCGASFGRR